MSLSRPDTVSVLFVCLGNICRSPAAEAVFAAAVSAAGLDSRISTGSAGTQGWHAGRPADARMVAAARNRGIELSGRARQVQPRDLDAFDFVIAMDRDNLDWLHGMHPNPTARIRLFSHWLDASRWPVDVPDPWSGGPAGFEQVLDMLSAGVPGVLADAGSLLQPEPSG